MFLFPQKGMLLFLLVKGFCSFFARPIIFCTSLLVRKKYQESTPREASQKFFTKFNIDRVQQLLGDDVWAKIVSGDGPKEKIVIFFEPEGEKYLVAHAPTKDDEINVYMTRISSTLISELQSA